MRGLVGGKLKSTLAFLLCHLVTDTAGSFTSEIESSSPGCRASPGFGVKEVLMRTNQTD